MESETKQEEARTTRDTIVRLLKFLLLRRRREQVNIVQILYYCKQTLKIRLHLLHDVQLYCTLPKLNKNKNEGDVERIRKPVNRCVVSVKRNPFHNLKHHQM